MPEALFSVAHKYAVCVRRLSAPRLVLSREHCSRVLFPAASVIKAGVMSCLLQDVMEHRYGLEDKVVLVPAQIVGGAGVLFELDPGHSFSLGELCRLMMVVSDNTASNACVRHIGLDRLNSFFRRRNYAAKMERFFMDPVAGGRDNTMTAEAAVLILADLYNGVDLSDELQEFAVGCLRRQQYREKIPLKLPPEVLVGHKTGELDGVRHDAAVVESAEPYVVAIFTAEGGDPWSVDEAIANMSLKIYQEQTS